MKRLAIAFGVLVAMAASPALADANVSCNGFGNMAFCSGYQDGTYVSYSCTDYGYEVDCTMTSPYWYHWTISHY